MKKSTRRVMSVLWPAFLMASVLEIVVFAFVDPASLHWIGGAPVGLDPTTVYSVAFMVFWAVVAAGGVLTQLLNESALEINSRSFR